MIKSLAILIALPLNSKTGNSKAALNFQYWCITLNIEYIYKSFLWAQIRNFDFKNLPLHSIYHDEPKSAELSVKLEEYTLAKLPDDSSKTFACTYKGDDGISGIAWTLDGGSIPADGWDTVVVSKY